jgi:hypothetical protein
MTGQGFVAWIIGNSWRSDGLGRLGNSLRADECLPKRIRSAEGLRRHLTEVHHADWDEVLAAAVREWLAR